MSSDQVWSAPPRGRAVQQHTCLVLLVGLISAALGCASPPPSGDDGGASRDGGPDDGGRDAEAPTCPPFDCSPSDVPVFLLAGQSNMEGNVDPTLFHTLLDNLASSPAEGRQALVEASLNDWYRTYSDGYAQYAASPEVARLEASELVALADMNLVGPQLRQPLESVWCTFSSHEEPSRYAGPLRDQCGSPFGPELTLGHSLSAAWGIPFALTKVASGGTTLAVDWRSPSAVALEGGAVGPLYTALADRITSLTAQPEGISPACVEGDCKWAAFIWFQGENDVSTPAHANAYERHLRYLIRDVRTATESPELPVVIVQIGHWATNLVPPA